MAALAKIYKNPVANLICWVIIAALGLGLIWPVAVAVKGAFVAEGKFSFYWFSRLTQDGSIALLINSLILAAITTTCSFLLAVPLAMIRGRSEFVGSKFFSIAILVPLILPPFVGAISMQRLLGQFGVLNLLLADWGWIKITEHTLPPDWLAGGLAAVVIIQTLHLFPIMYLNTTAAIANVDPAQLDAAAAFGASSAKRFFKILLPQILPGVFAGGTIVFIWSLTDIGTPLMLGYRKVAGVKIFDELTSGKYDGKVYALVAVLLLIAVICYIFGKFILGRDYQTSQTRATIAAPKKKLSLPMTLLAWLIFGTVILIAILPHVFVVLAAFAGDWFITVLPENYTMSHLSSVFEDPATLSSITNSLKYAGCSTAFDIIVGCVIAWLIVRAKVFGSGLLDALSMLPLAVPGLILAAGYVAISAPGTSLENIGPLGKYPAVMLIIAYSVRRLPFVVRGVGAGLQQLPESLEEASRNLGASRTKTFRRITLPLILGSLIAAGVLSFAFAMLEVSDSLVLAQLAADYPITKQIYALYNSGTGFSANIAAALGVLGMILLGATLSICSLVMGKKFGALFRA